MNELGEILQKTIQFFKTKGIDSARLDAELIFAHALKIQRIQIYTQHNKPLSDIELENCRELVRRRAKGEPVAYLTGSKWFYQSEFKVNQAVLIPRPETEMLVEHVVKFVSGRKLKAVSILDLGAGTGCIGISIFNELVKKNIVTKLVAVEKSESAFEVLKENANRLIAEKSQQDNCQFILGDASSVDLSFAGGFDVIAANPPYIEPNDKNVDTSVRQFEPHSALFSEDNGMKDIKAWSNHAIQYLHSDGLMIFEMGWDQASSARNWFESLGLLNVEIKKDLAEHDRFVLGLKRN